MDQLFVGVYELNDHVMVKVTSGKPGDCECPNKQKCDCGWKYIDHFNFTYDEARSKSLIGEDKKSIDTTLYMFKHGENQRTVALKLSTGGKECTCAPDYACNYENVSHKDYKWDDALTKFSRKMLDDIE